MNRSKPVSEKLQKKVIDTIKKYNYNPSVHARYLAGKQSRLLGFIMTNYINQYQLLLFRYLMSLRAGWAMVALFGTVIPDLRKT